MSERAVFMSPTSLQPQKTNNKMTANNNLCWFRRTQMKERITKRRRKKFKLCAHFFFGKSKLLQPALINIIEDDSSCPHDRPVRFLQG